MSLVHIAGLLYRDASGGEPLEGESTPASIDHYGLDELTRTFSMRPDLVEAFLRRYPVGTTDTEFPTITGMPARNPGMSVVSATPSKDRSWANVSLKLVGKMGTEPQEPLTKISEDEHEDTVQLQAIVEDSVLSVFVDYVAPSTRYEYCAKIRPTAPRYKDGALQVGDIRLIRKRGSVKFNGTDFGPLNTFSATEQRMGVFSRRQEGNWWVCSEEWKWVLIPSLIFFSKDLRTVIIT